MVPNPKIGVFQFSIFFHSLSESAKKLGLFIIFEKNWKIFKNRLNRKSAIKIEKLLNHGIFYVFLMQLEPLIIVSKKKFELYTIRIWHQFDLMCTSFFVLKFGPKTIFDSPKSQKPGTGPEMHFTSTTLAPQNNPISSTITFEAIN